MDNNKNTDTRVKESSWVNDGEVKYSPYGRKLKEKVPFNESLDSKIKKLVKVKS